MKSDTPNGLANIEFGKFGFQLNLELTYRFMRAIVSHYDLHLNSAEYSPLEHIYCLWEHQAWKVYVLQGLVYAGGHRLYCACNDMVIAHYVIIEQNHHIQYVPP